MPFLVNWSLVLHITADTLIHHVIAVFSHLKAQMSNFIITYFLFKNNFLIAICPIGFVTIPDNPFGAELYHHRGTLASNGAIHLSPVIDLIVVENAPACYPQIMC